MARLFAFLRAAEAKWPGSRIFTRSTLWTP